VSLHVENGDNGGDNGSFAKAEGKVTALVEAGAAGGLPGSITIADEHGSITFVIPAGFGPSGAVIGDEVDAKGTASTTPGGQPTLVRLEVDGDNGDNGDNNGDNNGSNGDNNGQNSSQGTNGGGDGSGSDD
jgi:hypothetical protein